MYSSLHYAFIVTDAISFNILMRGQLERLRDEGVKLSLFCGGSKSEREVLEARAVGAVHYVPFRRRPSFVWDVLALLVMTGFLARTRYDTVVCSTPKAMLIGSLAAMVTGQSRRFVIVRGRAYETYSGVLRWFYVQLDKLVFACSTKVIFISHSLRQSFDRDGLCLGEKGCVLGHGSSNGVDVSRFRPAESKEVKREVRRALDLPSASFIIMCVGRLAVDKGIYDALEIIERFGPRSDLLWLFVGPEEDHLACRRLRSLSRFNVRLIGRRGDVEDYFRAVDLHLFLSHREGFGNVAIEAAASGVPTFAYDVVGVRDSVIDGVTGRLFKRGDFEILHKAIDDAISDQTALISAYPDMREVVISRFESQRVWNRYARMFSSNFDCADPPG